jgi:hypothetical protein
LPTREQFFRKSKGCGLSDTQIYQLYRLLRKAAILYDQRRRGSVAERGKIEASISPLLQEVEKNQCEYLKEFVARLNQDDLNIIRQARAKNYSPYALSRALLDHHAEIYLDLLNLKESEREYMDRVISRLENRRKLVLGSRAWKYGLLAGVTAVGVGAGIYLHSKYKNEEKTEDK